MIHSSKGYEAHPHPTFLSDFILGSQDGLVNVLGILLGLSAASLSLGSAPAIHRLILVAAFAALGAESISMGAVAYTSTLARRRLYMSEVRREQDEMRTVPETERDEVRVVLKEWGYTGEALDDLLERICRNPRAWMEFMMAFELKLAPVKDSQARDSFVVVFLATTVGSFIPILPFLVPTLSIQEALLGSVGLAAVTLALVGVYEARTTGGKPFRNAAQMILIGLAAGFAGFLIGLALGAT
ncbi:MAG TPA: VIT1/CCC1 transporter family protein [Thermoplasmata archaeon]|nr:VIT1/CCC1 transporter family protein [Thermoplasmata archaeon]